VRNRYVDLLRAAAIVRVVIYHTIGGGWLTVLFPAMGLMFSLGGSLMAASLDRSGPSAVVRRMRRILPPVWILAVFAVSVMAIVGGLTGGWRLVLWFLPLDDPPMTSWGAGFLGMFWYIRTYVWFILLSPLLLPAFRRWPIVSLVTPFVALIALEASQRFANDLHTDLLLYAPMWMLGFAHHDGTLRRLPKRLIWSVSAVLAGAGLAWMWTHQGTRGVDLNDIPLANVPISIAFLLFVLSIEPRVTSLGRATGLIEAINRRALTVYLWHEPSVALVMWLLSLAGLTLLSGWGQVARVGMVFATVAVVALALGWVEDLAARRKPALWRVPRKAAQRPVPPTAAQRSVPRAAVEPTVPTTRPAIPAPASPVPDRALEGTLALVGARGGQGS
jgi:peptidoglycan/LPS O-acetylase OafA/YrhL